MKCPACDTENPPDHSTCELCEKNLDQRPSPDADLVKTVVLWVAIVIVLAGGGWITVVSWPGGHGRASSADTRRPAEEGSTSAAPGTDAPGDESSQAAVMNGQLDQIVATHSKLPSSIGSCADATSNLGVLQQIVSERSDQVDAASNLHTDQLTDGTELGSALVHMVKSNLEADQAYLDWAQNAQSSGTCTDADQDSTINAANQKAAEAKRDFADKWNSHAALFGQPTHSWKTF